MGGREDRFQTVAAKPCRDGALRPNRGALCRTYRAGLQRLPRRVVFRVGFGSAGGAAATREAASAWTS
jgi:hypothetical protein